MNLITQMIAAKMAAQEIGVSEYELAKMMKDRILSDETVLDDLKQKIREEWAKALVKQE